MMTRPEARGEWGEKGEGDVVQGDQSDKETVPEDSGQRDDAEFTSKPERGPILFS